MSLGFCMGAYSPFLSEQGYRLTVAGPFLVLPNPTQDPLLLYRVAGGLLMESVLGTKRCHHGCAPKTRRCRERGREVKWSGGLHRKLAEATGVQQPKLLSVRARPPQAGAERNFHASRDASLHFPTLKTLEF